MGAAPDAHTHPESDADTQPDADTHLVADTQPDGTVTPDGRWRCRGTATGVRGSALRHGELARLGRGTDRRHPEFVVGLELGPS